MIQSIIRQEGCKYSYLKDLYSLFPEHEVYIEPFLGSGVVALNHNCSHKFLNDHNKLVYYFFLVMRTRRGPGAIADEIMRTPKYIKIIYMPSTSLIVTLARYIMIGYTTMYGKNGGPMLFEKNNSVEIALERIKNFESALLRGSQFFCGDFRDFLKVIKMNKCDPAKHFVYCDPPYVSERGALKTNSKFTEADVNDLYDILVSRPWKFAISCRSKSAEFWRGKGLKIFEINSVKGSLKSQKGDTEYLACNYVIQPELF